MRRSMSPRAGERLRWNRLLRGVSTMLLLTVGASALSVDGEAADSTSASTPLSWDLDSASGWKVSDDGHLHALDGSSELNSKGSVPGDFALRFRFRFGEGIPQEVPLWLRFRSGGRDSEYGLGFHKSLGTVLHATGRGLIAGLPPGTPWPPGSSSV